MTTLTEGDLQASIDRVERAMRESGVKDLADLIRRIARTSSRATRRAPLGVVHVGTITRGHTFTVPLDEPQLAGRPTHLILDPSSARAYDLVDFKIGNRSEGIGWRPIPCDLFSVEYAGTGDRLAQVLAWRGCNYFSPAVRLSLSFVRNGWGHDPSSPDETRFLQIPIRGLLWCEVEEP